LPKFKQHIPSFFDFFKPIEFEFNSKEELENKYKDKINKDIGDNGEIFSTNKEGNLFMIYSPKLDEWYVLGYVYDCNLLDYYEQYEELRKENK